MPTTPAECQRIAEGFSTLSKGAFQHCVGAVDGIVIKTRKPTAKEVGGDDVKAWRNRKGCWGMVAMAGVDHDCKFIFFTCRHTGSTHDSLAI